MEKKVRTRRGEDLSIRNFRACGNGDFQRRGFIRYERVDVCALLSFSAVSQSVNACGCGEFISPSHRLSNSLHSSEGQLFPLSSPPTAALSFIIPPSSFLWLSVSLFRSLSLAGFAFHPAVQQQSIATTRPFKFKGSFIGRIEICIAKKPPGNKLHWISLAI